MIVTNELKQSLMAKYLCTFILVIFVVSSYANAQEVTPNLAEQSSIYANEDEARFYRNPEERREAGLGRQLTEWLTFSGLVELEKEFEELNFSSDKKVKRYQRPVSTLQLGFDAEFSEWLTAELVFETENGDHHSSRIDEVFFSAEFGNLGIEAGKLTVPFGEFYSHFITGPLLEFGETKKDALALDYSLTSAFELTSFIIDSEAKKQNNSNSYDWGAGINYISETEATRLGISYLSDLAESDERFLRDENDTYERRVSAWSAYTLIGFNQFEITGEILQANNGFKEFGSQEDKPYAYNLELAYFPTHKMQLAIRFEGSDKFEDQPKQQYGLSGTWRVHKNISITAEYLHAEYKNNFILDDNDEDLDDRDIIATQLSIEF